MSNALYNVVWYVFRAGFDLLFPCRVSGLENVPAEGGFVLCINHLSALDPLYVSAQLPRKRRMYFLAKKELFGNRLFAKVVGALGGIPIDRGNADIAAMRTTLQMVKDGKGMGIFPQGTRSKDNSPTPMLPGASMIALRAGVPVVPCYIGGPYRLFRRIGLKFGAPIDFSDFGRRCDHDTLEAATARIADAIWSMKE